LAVFVVLVIVIAAAQNSFKTFSESTADSVCDIDGSLGAVSTWFDDLSSDVDGLSTKISGYLEEGRTAVFKTVDSLEPTIDGVNKTLATVLKNVAVSTTAITTAFADYDLNGDISLKVGELDKQMDNLNKNGGDYKSIIKDSKAQVDTLVNDVQGTIKEFPSRINTMLQNASATVSNYRRDMFTTGQVSVPAIPVLLDNGLKDATVIDAVSTVTDVLQKLVLIMYIPIFISAPVLLIGGIVVIAVFVFCRQSKGMTCFGLCGSKCGCVLLWLGLFAILGTSFLFLVLSQVYNDTCAIMSDPVYVINFAQKNDQAMFQQLVDSFPKTNFTQDFDVETAVATAKQCLAGSSYRGPSLAKTIGINLGFVDSLLAQAHDSIDSGDSIDLGIVDNFIDKSTSEINNFKARANDYKLDSAFFTRAQNSCTQCDKFGDTFKYFDDFDDKNLKLFGEACDEACKVQPAKQCANYVPTSTYPPVETVIVNGVTKIKLPNGQLVDAPPLLVDVIKDNGGDTNACEACRNRTCGMNELGVEVNRAIDDVSANLSVLINVIRDTNQTIRNTLNSLTGEVKTVITKSADALKETVEGVDCAIVGDVYNNFIISVCSVGLQGFKDYAWAFVWCACVGVLLIIATILLNLCVGLRPLDEDGNEKEFPDQRIELSGRAYLGSGPKPVVHAAYESQPEAYVSAINYIPSAVPAPGPGAGAHVLTGPDGYLKDQIAQEI